MIAFWHEQVQPAALIVGESKVSIELSNGVIIEVITASRRHDASTTIA